MKPSKILLVLGTAFVVACGGGGSRVAGIDGGGSPAPVVINVVSQGTITGFGSVIVNDVRYDTSGATITVDGSPGVESDLTVGQVVVVEGTLDSSGTTGTATRVTFDDAVEGPIESIDLPNDSMVVLGQTVMVNGNTSYEDEISPKSLDGLAVDDIVEVSGYPNSLGNIVATHIKLEAPGGEFEITGLAQNVDTTLKTLEVNDLVVDYGGVMVLDDFPNGEPENGQLVEAKGSSPAAGELDATRLEFKGNDIDLGDVDEVEIEGIVTRFASLTDFDVNGFPATTTGSTQYENGTSADVARDRKIEVEGELDTFGVLVAEKIELKQDGTIRIGAPVEAVGASRLTLLGNEFVVNSGTEFDDQSDLDEQNFDLADISVGEYVEVRGYVDTSTNPPTTFATRVERDDDPFEVFVRGFVEAVSDPEFTIRGVTIRTNAGTDFEDNDVPIMRDDFFDAPPDGRLVEAKGTLQNDVIIAVEVEFED